MDFNKLAVRVAQYFFAATGKRATSATMKQTIGQAKSLLKAGFKPEEIIHVINELVEHPPKDGLKSLGYLSYVIEDVLIKIKAKEVRNKLIDRLPSDMSSAETNRIQYNIANIDKRIGDEFTTNLF